ncbi:MAG: hypothetical protein ABIQ15_03660 [Nocardioides sp.]
MVKACGAARSPGAQPPARFLSRKRSSAPPTAGGLANPAGRPPGRHYSSTISLTASIDDHLLGVYAIVGGRLRDHVSIAPLLRDGRLVEHERVDHLTTRCLRITTSEPLPVNLDGELAALAPATFEVERNVLHVVVAATRASDRWDGRGDHTA